MGLTMILMLIEMEFFVFFKSRRFEGSQNTCLNFERTVFFSGKNYRSVKDILFDQKVSTNQVQIFKKMIPSQKLTVTLPLEGDGIRSWKVTVFYNSQVGKNWTKKSWKMMLP